MNAHANEQKVEPVESGSSICSLRCVRLSIFNGENIKLDLYPSDIKT